MQTCDAYDFINDCTGAYNSTDCTSDTTANMLAFAKGIALSKFLQTHKRDPTDTELAALLRPALTSLLTEFDPNAVTPPVNSEGVNGAASPLISVLRKPNTQVETFPNVRPVVVAAQLKRPKITRLARRRTKVGLA